MQFHSQSAINGKSIGDYNIYFPIILFLNSYPQLSGIFFLCRKPLVIYEVFKVLATQLSIGLFLSHDVSQEDVREISELMTTHWRGIISVPVSVRAPWSNWKSGYSKALAAKVCVRKIFV